MNRKETTKFLSDLLISKKFSGAGKYWAKEVSIDPTRIGLSRRVDFMQFIPPGQTTASAIEKGIFVCYEIKSCREDVFSGNGLNFIGEKNYIVTTMQGYKDILPDYRDSTLDEHIKKLNGRKVNYGILVAMPDGADRFEEMNKPTPIETECTWKLEAMIKCVEGLREKSMDELLFCMLRSGKN